MNEFDFIRQYLTQTHCHDMELIQGIGDDAAILRPKMGFDWHISSDILLENRHFFSDVTPEDLAYKALAVNLSDMAAMGAQPKWCLLSVALPDLNKNWLTRFCGAFFSLAKQYNVQLIGGDTTKEDEKVLSVTIIGQTPQGKALRRNRAVKGDDIWVTGLLGLAAAALHHQWQYTRLNPLLLKQCKQRRLRPIPRVEFAQAILDDAHACLDISDGLAQDIGHILNASKVGACINVDDIPSLFELKSFADYYNWILSGGDDYELIFTAPQSSQDKILLAAKKTNTMVSKIGSIIENTGYLELLLADGSILNLEKKGFDHFEE